MFRLWNALRKQIDCYKFRRQHIIGDYIADFAAPECMLIIEVDGAYHSEREQQYNDEVRANVLKRTGFCLLRFSNEEVLHNTQDTLNKIK